MREAVHSADRVKLQRERDLYLRLLSLGRQQELEPFLREALALIVEVSEARQGYLELHDDDESGADAPRWWIAHGLSPEGDRQACGRRSRAASSPRRWRRGRPSSPRRRCSIPRFSERDSVRLGKIEAVLCAPIGDDPPRGVLYLQGGASSGLFSDEARARAETFARHLAPLADRLLAQHRRAAATRSDARAARRRCGSTASSAAARRWRRSLRQVALVAPLDVSVLLTGESGTGKSQLARVIHDNGPRAGAAVRRAQLRRAARDADRERAVRRAPRRALDRDADASRARWRRPSAARCCSTRSASSPLAAQAKLLQLLQSKEYYPLGANKPVRADVRVIAATNTDLQRAVAERRFREDLFYRLQVLPIRVPSLAERREDIARAGRVLLPQPPASGTACRASSCRATRCARSQAAEWPGNVRQLAHAVEAAAIRAAGEGVTQIERAHLFPDAPASRRTPSAPLTFQEATRRFHERLLRDDARGDAVERRRDRAPPRSRALARLQPDPRLRPRAAACVAGPS